MAQALEGVRVGPLDPDATESFGQVAQGNTARQLIRLHRQLHPPELVRALARPLDEAHTKAAKESLEEITDHLGTLEFPNGDPLVPSDAKVIDAAVRGDKATGQVLTFQYVMPSGRVGKWYTEYHEDDLPEAYSAGQEYAKVREMKDRGMVAYDTEGTSAELLRRSNTELRREVAALRAQADGQDVEVPRRSGAKRADARRAEEIAGAQERLAQENAELRRRNAELEQLSAAQGGGMSLEGADEVVPGGAGGTGEGGAAAQEPPLDDYENLKADQLVKRIRHEDTSPEDVQAILEYERSHAGRKSVVGAAEQRLDRS